MENIKVKYLSDRGVWGGTGALTTRGHWQVSTRTRDWALLGCVLCVGVAAPSAGAPTSWLPTDGTRLSPVISSPR